jgi:hypothetical protein
MQASMTTTTDIIESMELVIKDPDVLKTLPAEHFHCVFVSVTCLWGSRLPNSVGLNGVDPDSAIKSCLVFVDGTRGDQFSIRNVQTNKS